MSKERYFITASVDESDVLEVFDELDDWESATRLCLRAVRNLAAFRAMEPQQLKKLQEIITFLRNLQEPKI